MSLFVADTPRHVWSKRHKHTNRGATVCSTYHRGEGHTVGTTKGALGHATLTHDRGTPTHAPHCESHEHGAVPLLLRPAFLTLTSVVCTTAQSCPYNTPHQVSHFPSRRPRTTQYHSDRVHTTVTANSPISPPLPPRSVRPSLSTTLLPAQSHSIWRWVRSWPAACCG